MIQIFSIPLAANEAREVAVSGEYFELRNAPSPIALVELLDRSGGVISRLENPEQSDFVKPGRYETIRITNGPTAQTVRHFYGSGDAGSRRTSGLVKVDGTVGVMGNVSVIDGGKSRTLSGESYLAGYFAPSGPAVYGYLHLFNPAASGKNLVVTQLQFSSSSSPGVYLSGTVAELGVDAGTHISNKKIGNPAGVGKFFRGSDAAILNAAATFNYQHINARAPSTLRFADPLIIPPGRGVLMQADAVNAELSAVYEYFEEPV